MEGKETDLLQACFHMSILGPPVSPSLALLPAWQPLPRLQTFISSALSSAPSLGPALWLLALPPFSIFLLKDLKTLNLEFQGPFFVKSNCPWPLCSFYPACLSLLKIPSFLYLWVMMLCCCCCSLPAYPQGRCLSWPPLFTLSPLPTVPFSVLICPCFSCQQVHCTHSRQPVASIVVLELDCKLLLQALSSSWHPGAVPFHP